mmetsp:Transcript_39661/g.55073  ORF Transcript_39661/g.55073 Transcript_39661/m.55073 type:complete len:215 (-) Transcript_39661:146-790(-)|eukprot:CAMPEP_0196579526 /NCGR_PEP_ID=MMETSP1081-20130531/22222_1 /TAXON_ID=36882 /ORGANISM="Pyramimonas amylifera, Strain CCMP720" /LENGTH=214 /DNA_ID=CAMNT_0041899145 /DNA_START=134 /DNA_END=778 /DNA_ORIENTATION=+
MARLYKSLQVGLSAYRDRRFDGSQDEYEDCLKDSTTVYVGNLSFYTTEEQILDLFSRVGEVRRIVIGLDKQRLTPCGFCFVVFYTRQDTEICVNLLGGSVLDERPIRVDIDWGFQEGRQFGRGKSGGQVRDEYRTDYDDGRGGYGKIVQRELETQQMIIQASAEGDASIGDVPDSSNKKRGRGDDESSGMGKRSRGNDNPRFREGRDDDDDDRD